MVLKTLPSVSDNENPGVAYRANPIQYKILNRAGTESLYKWNREVESFKGESGEVSFAVPRRLKTVKLDIRG